MNMKSFTKLPAMFLCIAIFLSCSSANPANTEEEITNDDYPVFHQPVPLTKKYFPDPVFRKYMASTFDEDHDGFLHEYELRLIWNIHCENMAVTSVKGIEYLPYLKGLWCKGNNITELDFSGNPDMRGIWCSFNNIKKLDFSPCPKLEWIYCFECGLEEIDVSKNPELGYLECNLNRGLTSIDLTHNPKLENLFISKCSLKELDISKNPLLCELAAFDNQLTTLDVSNNPLLKRLDVWDNPSLKNMDVSKLKGLQYYNVAKTAMTKVDVTHNPELVELVASYNDGIKSIDLSGNPKLQYLNVECNTNLQNLDLSHNPRLYHLYAFGLTSLDVIDISKNSRLCKAYNEGRYERDEERIGLVYFKNLAYGGSEDPFDDLNHIIGVDDKAKVIAVYNGTKDVPDSILDTKDGHSNNEKFVTRGQAILTLYQLAESPAVSGTSRFTDVSRTYAAAVKWGEDNNICFGFPQICANTFYENEYITRQDWALMAHRFADYMKFGTAFDYGRSDWFDDFYDIDFYAWGAFTWAIQWRVVPVDNESNKCYPHGRITIAEFEKGAAEIFDLDEGASYAQRVGGNFGADYVDPGTSKNKVIEVHIPVK